MPQKSIRVLVRGLAVLEALNKASPSTAGEIATRLSLPRGTVLRLCETLRSEGFIERAEDKTYQPAIKARLFASALDDEEWIARYASPCIETFAHSVNWPSGLATLTPASDRVHIRSDTDAHRSIQLTTGRITSDYFRPILGSSAGLVLLAHLSKTAQNAILDIVQAMSAYEDDKVVENREQVYRALAKVRKNGFSLRHARFAKISHLSVPVFDAAGGPIAALWVRYFSNVMDGREAIGKLLDPMQELAQQISRTHQKYQRLRFGTR